MVIVLFYSCTKGGVETNGTSNSSSISKLSYKNKMLVFNSVDDYIFVSDQLKKRDLNTKGFKDAFPEFISMEDAYLQFINSKQYENLQSIDELARYKDFLRIRKEEGEVYIEPLLDLEKPKLYNSEGFIQIGDQIIKRELDQEIILNAKFVDSYSALKKEFSNKDNLIVSPVKILIQNTTSHISQGGLEPRADCLDYWCNDPSVQNCTWKYKFIGTTIFDNPSGMYSVTTVGAETRSYKKGTFGWSLNKDGFYLDQTGTVTVTTQSTLDGSINTTTFTVNEHSSYTGSDHTIENYNQGCCLTILSASSNVTFTGIRYNGSTAYPKSCHL